MTIILVVLLVVTLVVGWKYYVANVVFPVYLLIYVSSRTFLGQNCQDSLPADLCIAVFVLMVIWEIRFVPTVAAAER